VNPFEELLEAVRFENVIKGRQGTVLLNPQARGTPIVRTTSKYQAPAQCFRPAHVRLAQRIQKLASLSVAFNNALVELYTNVYATMGPHSDQAQDLQNDTHIAVFSCYKHPELANPAPRKLVVMSKEPNGGSFEIPLRHNSVVVFSLNTNRRFKHKIVLDTKTNPPENEWLGITFRTSKTFVQVEGDEKQRTALLENGTALTMANQEEKKEFYTLRRRENQELDFEWPQLTYTISESDRMTPVYALVQDEEKTDD
jgi:hypothetical protein